jgi:hypothetical protein
MGELLDRRGAARHHHAQRSSGGVTPMPPLRARTPLELAYAFVSVRT